MKAYLFLLRTYFRLVSFVSPNLAASQACRLFQRPIVKITRPLEQLFFEKVEKFQLDHSPEPIDCFELGSKDGDVIVLIRGWESNAGSMSAIATSLADQGFRVVLFNLPAHGQSKLKHANLKTCGEALDRVLNYYKYSGTPSIVSHSFGSAVATFTLARKGHEVDKFIMLSTPDKIIDIFNDFRKVISLGNGAFDNLLSRVKDILGEEIENIAIHSLTNQVKYKELNIIHDEYDRILPYANSLNVYRNSQKSTLTTLEKVGHYKMLWDTSVIRTVLATLTPNQRKLV